MTDTIKVKHPATRETHWFRMVDGKIETKRRTPRSGRRTHSSRSFASS
jgi:hypothetical protein